MNDETKVPDAPQLSADNWYAFAVVGAIMLFAGATMTAIAVIGEDNPEARLALIQTVGPFGIIGVALTTFCTIAWRAQISTRQIDKISEQIASTEENNLALLLQKGAELLAETDSRAHLAAGIATLQAVITAKNDKFIREAMDLIADLIDERFEHSNHEPLFRASTEALGRGHERDYTASRTVTFSYKNGLTVGPWQLFPGVEKLIYTGGNIINHMESSEKANVLAVFQNVRFEEAINLSVDNKYQTCTFIRCSIREIALDKNGRANFIDCNFSDAFWSGSDAADVSFTGCHYSKESPPKFARQWLEKLETTES